MKRTETVEGRQQQLDEAVRTLGSLAARLSALDSKAVNLATERKVEALLDVCDELRELHVTFVDVHRRLMTASAVARMAKRQELQAECSDGAGNTVRF